MKDHPKYLLVDSQILPEVYLKVILAKKLLAQGKVKSSGILIPENAFEPEIIFKELKKRDIFMHEEWWDM